MRATGSGKQGLGETQTAWETPQVFWSEAQTKHPGQPPVGTSAAGSVGDRSGLFHKNMSGLRNTRYDFTLTGSDVHRPQVWVARH